ncbi:sensor histidine kinase [Nocardioides cynanchi]|uniref:sensor histidine kinase n=1 Tax=Nocardioides cynanchi TaxID=2558918 RepID=UPI0012460B6A|nr:histidine kinase [Nocardioides cynanchi]
MIWGSPRRQYTWLAIGARAFALLTLAMPIIVQHSQLMLLALVAMGSIWAAVTAGELLEIPVVALFVLDAALIGSVVGLSSHNHTAVIGALAVPPFTAGLQRGTRGVALSMSAQLASYVVVSTLTQGRPGTDQAGATFTWTITGLGLGLIASFVRANFLDGNDPQRAYRDAQSLIRELIGLSGRLSSGLDPVALGGQIESAVRDELPVAALTVHIPRGEVLTPLVGDTTTSTPDLVVSEALAQECLATGNVRVSGHSFAFPLNSGSGPAAVVSGVLAPGLDPDVMDLPRRLSALDRKLSPATVRLDTAVLFLAFRDSATVEERRRLAREMHDGVAQEIASLGYFVDTLVQQEPEDSARHRQLTMLRERLTMVVGEVRRSVQTLRTSIGENDSLGTAIGSLARHLSASSGIPIHVTLDEQTTRLRSEVESELLRIAQEAMTNAVRHSGAATIDVLCRVAPPSAEIVVSDDGNGLGTGRDDSHGMEIMRERATLIGALLDVDDRAPRGTTVAVRLSSNGVSATEPSTRPDTLTA